jgi:hypothetical protein
MFKFTDSNSMRSYVGDPSCAAAYEWVLELLRDTTGAWLSNPADFNDRIKGNIGEFVAFHLTKKDVGADWYVFYSNTDTPLSRISGAGLDICYLFLGSDAAGAEDRLIIQEIKTTGSPNLSYAEALVSDYDKLRSVDPSLNLQARVRALKARMRDTHSITDRSLLDRVQLLAHPHPAKCSKMYLLPTLVHELKGSDPVPRLSGVRAKIALQGWSVSLIFPVSIGLTRLNDGLMHLAQNKSFTP